MSEFEILDLCNLLVIGVDNVPLAASAKRAGYQVFAVDHFGDQDLKRLCRECLSVIRQEPGKSCGRLSNDFSPHLLLQLTEDLLEGRCLDAALLTSGLDDSSECLFELNERVPILGNHPAIIEKVRAKTRFFHELNRIGVDHPETAIVEDFEGARRASKNIGYPVLVKPGSGFGGVGIRKAEDFRELKQTFRKTSSLNEKVLIQEYILGTHASASLISTVKGAVTLTVNQQLIGMRELGQAEPFGYCGNVIPLSASRKVVNECMRMGEKVVRHFSLVGSNGVDFVISKEGRPYVIEVNPRFQGTLECVERVLGMNVVKAHVEACVNEKLPEVAWNPSCFCARMILYASKRLVIPDLNAFEEARDIPLSGVVVEKGEPICSVVTGNLERASLVRETAKTAEAIAEACNSV